MPTISAIMPVKNGSKYIVDTINSIKSQSYIEWELIIVDDHSQDNTSKIVEQISVHDSRIKLIRQEPNLKGVAAALNTAINHSIGNYIVRIDADDICHLERFKKQLEFLVLNPDIGVLGSSVKYIDSKGHDIGTGNKFESDLECKWHLLFCNPFYHPSVMIRKSLLKTADGYRNVKSEDLDLWHRLAPITKFHNLSESLLSYRIHDSQVTKTLYGDDNNRHVYKVKYESLKNISPSLALCYSYEYFMASRNRGDLKYKDFFGYCMFIIKYSIYFCKKESNYEFLFSSLFFGFKQIIRDAKHLFRLKFTNDIWKVKR